MATTPSTSREARQPTKRSHFDGLHRQFPQLSGPAFLLPQLNTGGSPLRGRATGMRRAFCDQVASFRVRHSEKIVNGSELLVRSRLTSLERQPQNEVSCSRCRARRA